MRSVYRPSLGTSARAILSDRAALLAQEGSAQPSKIQSILFRVLKVGGSHYGTTLVVG